MLSWILARFFVTCKGDSVLRHSAFDILHSSFYIHALALLHRTERRGTSISCRSQEEQRR